MGNERAPILKIKRLFSDAKMPVYATDGSAGFDLFTTESGILNPGAGQLIFPLGVKAEIPKNWAVLFVGKSGLASQKGVAVLGGLIDSDYRGEWMAILINNGTMGHSFSKGDKVVQGVLMFTPQAKIMEVDELSETKRGKGGFGSTGRK